MKEANHSPSGSVLGGSLLIAGCCIGAGMLGLPVITAQAGFKPSLMMFLFSWFFMVTTGLLVLEVNLWFKGEVSFVSMAKRTLGIAGEYASWGLFLFLFYSLMVAYISGTGSIFANFINDTFQTHFPDWGGGLTFLVLFGLLIFCGTHTVDLFNRLLMLGLIISYFALVFMGKPHVNVEYLAHSDWKEAAFIVPVMIISFGYHNLIPSMTNYFHGDAKKLRKTIIIGSAIPLVCYLVWEWLILGLIPLEGPGGFQEAFDKGGLITQSLKAVVKSPWVITFAECFAFFAIVTSFLGVSLSFVDFLSDGLHIPKIGKQKLLLLGLVLFPPFVLAVSYPHIFLLALTYAGSFGAVTLFGVMPALMVWVGRYRKNLAGEPQVPGGKAVLSLIILFALLVMVFQLIQDSGVLS